MRTSHKMQGRTLTQSSIQRMLLDVIDDVEELKQLRAEVAQLRDRLERLERDSADAIMAHTRLGG